MGIRALARELNLSIGTVSRALNDRPEVNEETRARVKAAAIRAGYVPNLSGRNLRRGRTGVVATVLSMPDPNDSAATAYLRILEGVRRTLLGAELDLVYLFRGPDDDPLENLEHIVSRRMADAIIVAQTRAGDERPRWLSERGVEFAALGRISDRDAHTWVDIDLEGNAGEAVRQLVAAGHRRISLIVGSESFYCSKLIEEGFVSEMRRQGLELRETSSLRAQDTRIEGALDKILAREGGSSAFVVADDGIAANLYMSLAARGLRPGVHVSVICVCPPSRGQGLNPALAHFDADLDSAGVTLALQLIARLSSAEAVLATRQIKVPMHFARAESHVQLGVHASA